MSTREDRYRAAMVLAHEILDGPPDEDGRRLAEAVADLTGELVAGRKNQQEFPDVSAEVFERLANPKPRLFSVRVDEEAS
jgi:predicted ATPase